MEFGSNFSPEKRKGKDQKERKWEGELRKMEKVEDKLGMKVD